MGNGGAVVTHLPPISEVCRSKPVSYVEKLVVAYIMKIDLLFEKSEIQNTL